VGFVPGVLIAGGAAAAGKALDEGIEYAQGLQDQSFGDVMRASALEGAFSVFGEGVGRGLSNVFGRMIKGPGGAKNEVLRQQARELIDRGFRPTIEGATDEGFRPILNRLQSVYEAVFPNKEAATQNLNQIVKELEALRVIDPKYLDDLSDVVRRDIDDLYSNSTESLLKAQQALDVATRSELGKVYASLRKGDAIPQDMLETLQLRKRIFEERIDRVFTKTNGMLDGQPLISTAGIKSELARLSEETIADVEVGKFAKFINALPDVATVRDVAKIRSALAEASYNPELVGSVQVGALSRLKSSVTSAINEAEVNLALATGTPLEAGVTIVSGPTIPLGEAQKALSVLRRANKLYREGMARFDNVLTTNLFKRAQKGEVNEKFIFDRLVMSDEPEQLQQLLRAIRGVKSFEDVGAISPLPEVGAKTQRQRMINGRTIEETKSIIERLPEKNLTRRSLIQEVRRAEAEMLAVKDAARTGAEQAEALRQSLGRMYINRVFDDSLITDPSTGLKVLDPTVFVANFRKKGSTLNVLFRNEKKQVEELLSVMEKGRADLAPSVIKEIMDKNEPVASSLMGLRKVQSDVAEQGKNSYLRVLGSGDVDAIANATLKSKDNIARAKTVLTPQAFEGVRDAAMGRILQQAGIARTTGGKVKMTDDFISAFRSGSLGDRLQGIVNSYGDESLDQLFGPGTAKAMNTIAADMIKTSNASIAGKGGLAAPQIALGLGIVSILTNPLATLPTAAAYMVMSKALRNKTVLKALMASRQSNSIKQFLSGKFKANDPIAQGLQVMNQLVAEATVQGTRGLTEQAEQETEAMQALAKRRAQEIGQDAGVNKMISDLGKVGQAAVNTVTAPFAPRPTAQPPGPAAASPQNVSPILVPDPATRAIFER